MRAVLAAAAAALFVLPIALSSPAHAAKGGEHGPDQRKFDPASDTENNHCFVDENHDWNAIFGVSEALVTRFCRDVDAGEWWIRPQLWFVASTWEAVPSGYTPAAPTPIEDFASKLVRVKYVVDPGTRQEKTYTFSGPAVLDTSLTAADVEEGGGGLPPDAPLGLTLAKAPPLNPGDHFVQTYMELSGEHCDGLTDDRELSCLPAGEFEFLPGRPSVRSRASQAE